MSLNNPQQVQRQQQHQQSPEALPPSLKEWALQQATEEEILAGLKEVQEKGGIELGEVIQRLEEKRQGRERSNP